MQNITKEKYSCVSFCSDRLILFGFWRKANRTHFYGCFIIVVYLMITGKRQRGTETGDTFHFDHFFISSSSQSTPIQSTNPNFTSIESQNSSQTPHNNRHPTPPQTTTKIRPATKPTNHLPTKTPIIMSTLDTPTRYYQNYITRNK